MAGKRLSPLRLTFILIVSLAAWVSAGALSVASAEPGSPRLGVLPSPAWLVAAFVLIAVPARTTRWGRSAILGLAALVLLPWLPLPVPPAFYIWTGHLRAWLWTAIGTAIAVPFAWRLMPAALRVSVADPQRAAWLAAAIASSLYLAGALQVFPQLPAGDEPHYLVITESLLSDHDLKVENNYRQADYRAYFPGTLRPDYLLRGQDNEIYSIHAPGLSILIAPVFAVLSYPGVLALLAVLSGCGTGLAWEAAWRATGDAGAAWFGWAAVALSAPFFFQSFVAYPDAVGGALVMLGALTLMAGAEVTTRRLAWTGVALALLPWLHMRLAIAAGVLGALIALRQLRGPGWPRRLVALLAVPAVSATAWLAFFHAIYGTIDPRAPYGGATQTAWSNAPRGLIGLAFDQQFGLFPNAPVYLCAALGFLPLLRRDTRLAIELTTVIVPYTLAVAAFQMWWGGTSSPARFLTPVLLTLAVPAAVWFHASRGRASRVLGAGALAVSLLITGTIALVDRGALLYNFRDGMSRLLHWLSPLVDLPTGLPSLFQHEPLTVLFHASLWLTAIALTALAGAAIARRTTSTAAIAAGVAAAGAAAGMVALSIVWRSNGAGPITPTTGNAALLQTYDAASGQIAVGYDPPTRVRLRDLPPRLMLATFPPAGHAAPPATDEPLLWVPHPPAATYLVEVALAKPGAGRLTVSLERQFGAAWTWDLSGASGVVRREFRLPVQATSFIVDGDAAARSAIERMTLRAVSRVAPRERAAQGEASHVARYGPALVFLMHGHAWMEPPGAWVAGGVFADFIVEPDDGSTPIRLFVRNPPVENHIAVDAGEWHQEMTFKPGEERTLEIPFPRGDTALAVRVTSGSGARPAAFERGSTDTRFLGCWIETR